MHKTPEEWSKVSALQVTDQSLTKITNVLQMALDDIASLSQQVERLEAEQASILFHRAAFLAHQEAAKEG